MNKFFSPKYWYGCKDCQFEPEPKKSSNKQWDVYQWANCSKCGKQMTIHLRPSPSDKQKQK